MSKTHKLPITKQPIGRRIMKPRESRHGRPLTDVYKVVVPAVTERKIMLNPTTDLYEPTLVEITPSSLRTMSPDEIQHSRNQVMRALGSTQTWGKKNLPPQQKVKKEKLA